MFRNLPILIFFSFDGPCSAPLFIFLQLFLDITFKICLSMHCFSHLFGLNLAQQWYSYLHHSYYYWWQVQKNGSRDHTLHFYVLILFSTYNASALFTSRYQSISPAITLGKPSPAETIGTLKNIARFTAAVQELPLCFFVRVITVPDGFTVRIKTRQFIL